MAVVTEVLNRWRRGLLGQTFLYAELFLLMALVFSSCSSSNRCSINQLKPKERIFSTNFAEGKELQIETFKGVWNPFQIKLWKKQENLYTMEFVNRFSTLQMNVRNAGKILLREELQIDFGRNEMMIFAFKIGESGAWVVEVRKGDFMRAVQLTDVSLDEVDDIEVYNERSGGNRKVLFCNAEAQDTTTSPFCQTCPEKAPCPECKSCPVCQACPEKAPCPECKSCPVCQACPEKAPCPECKSCPVCQACPEKAPCPECKSCPVCQACLEKAPCPECKSCPVCQAYPEKAPCPECKSCPVCQACPEKAPCPECKSCPVCQACPEKAPCPECKSCPVCQACPEKAPCPECKSCPVCQACLEKAPCPECKSCPVCQAYPEKAPCPECEEVCSTYQADYKCSSSNSK
ncbi:uncharacterized protein [Palaemon carinicauda]|uniref:uncharacterized protein n=1 Tax=Palaemon carinicauda TaxID=392227 RepID=UPI0035B5746A